MESKTKKCWFLKDGKRIEEGIDCICRFKSIGGLEIYDVIYNGEIIGEIYAGSPQNMKEGYSFELENACEGVGMTDSQTTPEMAASGAKRLHGEPDREGTTDNNASSPNPQTTPIAYARAAIDQLDSLSHEKTDRKSDIKAAEEMDRVFLEFAFVKAMRIIREIAEMKP